MVYVENLKRELKKVKLRYKKDYLLLKDQLEMADNNITTLLSDLDKSVKNGKEKDKEIRLLSAKLNKQSEELELLYKNMTFKINTIKELENEIKSLRGAKGGLTKQNNALLNLVSQLKGENKGLKGVIENLQKKLDETLTDKYVKVELPPEKPRKVKVMGIKRGISKNETKKILKEKSEIRGEN